MHDEGEVGADGQIRHSDQVRPRQFHEFQGLDQGHEILPDPAVEHHLGRHYSSEQVHEPAVVEHQDEHSMARRGDSIIIDASCELLVV